MPRASTSCAAIRTISPWSVVTVYVPPSDCVITTGVPAARVIGIPLGIWIALQSRRSVIGSRPALGPPLPLASLLRGHEGGGEREPGRGKSNPEPPPPPFFLCALFFFKKKKNNIEPH